MNEILKSLQDLKGLLPESPASAAADVATSMADVLDTRARTLERFTKGAYSAPVRALLAKAVPALAAHLKTKKPPRGLEQVIRGLAHEQLALLALRPLMNRIYAEWGQGPDRVKVPTQAP